MQIVPPDFSGLRQALAEGWAMANATRGVSIAYAAIFTLAGLAIVGSLLALGLTPFVVAAAGAFMLVGPAILAGFFGIARTYEAGKRPGFGSVIAGFTAAAPAVWALALVCAETPAGHLDEVRRAGCAALAAGGERVDLRAALEALVERYGVTRVRIDSGGALAGAMLRAGLVHEVSVLVQPVLVGGESPGSFYRAPDLRAFDGVVRLRLDGVEPLEDGVVLLLYEVARG